MIVPQFKHIMNGGTSSPPLRSVSPATPSGSPVIKRSRKSSIPGGRFSPPTDEVSPDGGGEGGAGPSTPGIALVDGLPLSLASSSNEHPALDDVDAAVSFAAASAMNNVNIREKRLTNLVSGRATRPVVSFSMSGKEDDSIQTTVSPREESAKLLVPAVNGVGGAEGSGKFVRDENVNRNEDNQQAQQ